MKESGVAAIGLVGVFALSASVLAVAQNAAPEAASPAPARPGLVILDFKPAMDDLMTMLVQPRHIRLYYAGQAKNWRLAGFEVNELRGALARIGWTIPNYRNINVDTAVAAIFADKLKAVDAAVKAADPAQFNTAYGEMTTACNDCHNGMEHPFLVIKFRTGEISRIRSSVLDLVLKRRHHGRRGSARRASGRLLASSGGIRRACNAAFRLRSVVECPTALHGWRNRQAQQT